MLIQSCEAGGHGANGASLVTLIPELVDHVQSLCQKLNIQPAVPVVAAGGIADARQVSSVGHQNVIVHSKQAKHCCNAAVADIVVLMHILLNIGH